MGRGFGQLPMIYIFKKILSNPILAAKDSSGCTLSSTTDADVVVFLVRLNTNMEKTPRKDASFRHPCVFKGQFMKGWFNVHGFALVSSSLSLHGTWVKSHWAHLLAAKAV